MDNYPGQEKDFDEHEYFPALLCTSTLGSGLIRATRNDYELVLQGSDFLGAQSNLDQDLVVPGLELVQAEPRVHCEVFTRLAPKRFPDTPP